jgi:arabinofuranosyltransferase
VPRRLLLAFAVPVFFVSAWSTRASMVDDAYVSLRYARNLALGHGLVYNAGQPPVEGYTNFLWVLWMAPGTVLPVHPATWATGWGLVFGALGVLAAGGLCHALVGRETAWSAIPALVLAALPVYGIACTNGLETAMYVALLLTAAWATLTRPALGAALAGSLYLVRPEGIAAGAALVGLGAWRAWRAGEGRRATVLFAIALAVVGPYFVARSAYFGTWGPNTFAAQAREPFLEMFKMNANYYERSAELYVGVVLLAFLALSRLTWERLALLVVAAGLSVVAMRVYNWMPGARLFLAPIALVLVVSGAVIADLRARVVLGPLLAAGVAWLSLGPSRASEARYDLRNTALPGNEAEEMGRRIARVVPAGGWLLSRDAGVVPYFAGPDVNVIDIHPYSLTDPHLTGKRFDVDHVLANDPAAIVTTAMTVEELPSSYPQDKQVLRDPRVKGRYVVQETAKQHHRRYFQLWLRADLVR